MNGGKAKKGFTIIEVMLFLAISGFLFVGIAAGAGTNISRQRYQTSVQDTAEFLRSQYSAVASTQIAKRATSDAEKTFCVDAILNPKMFNQTNWQWEGGKFDGASLKNKDQARGRTDCLIYGKVVVVNSQAGKVSSFDLLGGDYQNLSESAHTNIESGKNPTGTESGKDPTLEALKAVNASPFVSQVFQKCTLNYSFGKEHNIQWEASLEKPYSKDIAEKTILIVRSPVDGALHTYIHDGIIQADKVAGKNLLHSEGSGDTNCEGSKSLSYLASNKDLINSIFIFNNDFKKETVEFCIGSEDIFAYGSNRRMIRIAKDGHNASAVELMNMDEVRPENDENQAMRGQPWCD